MWDLFDFDGDGKTSLFEKVVGLELLENTSQGEETAIVGNESDDELDEDDPDEYDEDDIDDDDSGDDDFEDEDEF